MRRRATAHLELELASSAELLFSVAVAQPRQETLQISQNGQSLVAEELLDLHGTRLHRLIADAGTVTLDYEALVEGRAEPALVDDIDLARYLRPSRYCESDTLGPVARAEFSGLGGDQLLDAVSSWVGDRLSYMPGSSQPTDGAVQTLLGRRGVCRDYAHLVIAFLRALDVPARLVSVYAPGLHPMDFHAVAEAAIDGTWRVVDATTLAPRSSLLRIATGSDASDTAFLSTRRGPVALNDIEVSVVVDELPDDDLDQLVSIG